MPTFNAQDLARWTGGRWTWPPVKPFPGFFTDSREEPRGRVFIALRGDKFDGHTYVADVLNQGVAAAIVSREIPDVSAPCLVVDDTRRALLSMGGAYRASLSIRTIAVTGSVGKTSVKEMTADVVATANRVARTKGNFNNDIGLPLSLLEIEPDAQIGVFEVGMNHPGELEPLCNILRPSIGIITAVGPVHLEHFTSVEAIADEKATVFRALPADGLGILSADQPFFQRIRAAARCRVCTVSTNGIGDYNARELFGDSFRVTEESSGETAEFRPVLPGDYVIENMLLAIAAGRAVGLSWDDVRKGFDAFRPQKYRWECSTIRGVVMVNDAYNANPLSMRAAIDALRSMPVDGRRWLVLAGMRELGVTAAREHDELGRWIAAGPWAGLVAIGPDGAKIAEGARAGGMMPVSIHAVPDCRSAADTIARLARPGDAVLLKASRGEELERVVVAFRILSEGGKDS